MWYGVVLPDGSLNPDMPYGLPLLPGMPGSVPLVSGRAPAPFWLLSLSWFAPGCIGVGTPCLCTAGPGTAGVIGVTGATCSTCVRTVEGMSASLSVSLAGEKKKKTQYLGLYLLKLFIIKWCRPRFTKRQLKAIRQIMWLTDININLLFRQRQ